MNNIELNITLHYTILVVALIHAFVSIIVGFPRTRIIFQLWVKHNVTDLCYSGLQMERRLLGLIERQNTMRLSCINAHALLIKLKEVERLLQWYKS